MKVSELVTLLKGAKQNKIVEIELVDQRTGDNLHFPIKGDMFLSGTKCIIIQISHPDVIVRPEP